MSASLCLAARRERQRAGAEALDLATFFVGYPAGGATDTVARLVAEAMQGKYAESVVVQNRPGAGGQIAAVHVKGVPPDGATLLFTPAFPMIIHPHVYKDVRYDTLKDFVPVATTHFGTLALSVGPGTPDDVKTLKDFIAWAKRNPDKASFGAPSGGSQHFTGLMLARDADIKLQLVSYRGGAPSVTDALGGHVPAIVTPLAEVLPHAREGKLRILATTARERSVLAPDIPTFFELGFEKIVVQDWSGFLAPAGTPPRGRRARQRGDQRRGGIRQGEGGDGQARAWRSARAHPRRSPRRCGKASSAIATSSGRRASRRSSKRRARRVARMACAASRFLQHALDPRRELLDGERLGHDLHAAFDMPVAEHGILRIAGDEQDLQVGMRRARGVGELTAVQSAGQADIGDQQVDPRRRIAGSFRPDAPSAASRHA